MQGQAKISDWKKEINVPYFIAYPPPPTKFQGQKFGYLIYENGLSQNIFLCSLIIHRVNHFI
jgi:hypothetical protein